MHHEHPGERLRARGPVLHDRVHNRLPGQRGSQDDVERSRSGRVGSVAADDDDDGRQRLHRGRDEHDTLLRRLHLLVAGQLHRGGIPDESSLSHQRTDMELHL